MYDDIKQSVIGGNQMAPASFKNSSRGKTRHAALSSQQRRAWVGSPSTYKEFTYSSSANRHITNSQEWAAEVGAPNVFKRLHVRSRKDVSIARQQRSMQKAAELRNFVKENSWTKTPCATDWVPKIPDYDGQQDPCCPFTHSGSFKKHAKRMAKAERRTINKKRQQQADLLHQRHAWAEDRIVAARERRTQRALQLEAERARIEMDVEPQAMVLSS
jgi:hypothetical protein